MCGNAPIEDPPKHSALTAGFASAGVALLLFVLVTLLTATGPRESLGAISHSADPASPPGTLLAQTDLPPGSDLEKEEEDWEEEPVDTLSFPQGSTSPQGTTPPPTGSVPPSTGAPAAAAAAADSIGGAGADSTGGAGADSTGGARAIPVVPAIGDTLRYVPGVVPVGPKPASAQAAPEPRKGILGIHPAAIVFGLVVAHYFIVKAATN